MKRAEQLIENIAELSSKTKSTDEALKFSRYENFESFVDIYFSASVASCSLYSKAEEEARNIAKEKNIFIKESSCRIQCGMIVVRIIKSITKQQLREEKREIKNVTYKDLANYLGVSESAVKKWDPKRRELMLLGLSIKK